MTLDDSVINILNDGLLRARYNLFTRESNAGTDFGSLFDFNVSVATERVNIDYKRMYIPPHLFVAMWDTKMRLADIRGVVGSLSNDQLTGLWSLDEEINTDRESEYADGFIILAKTDAALVPDRVDMLLAMSDSKLELLPYIKDLDDPIEYLDHISDKHVDFLNKFSSMYIGPDFAKNIAKEIEPIKPHLVGEYFQFYHHWSPAKRAGFFSGAINETLEAYTSLPEETKWGTRWKTLETQGSPKEAGILLRVFGEFGNVKYERFRRSYLKYSGKSSFSDTSCEPYLKEFVEFRDELAQKDRDAITLEMNINTEHRDKVMKYAMEYYTQDQRKFKLATELVSINAEFSSQDIAAVVDNNYLLEQHSRIPIDERSIWARLVHSASSIESAATMSDADFNSAKNAYGLACANKDADRFLNGFKLALERGNVSKWSEAIIKHHLKNAAGGDSYNTKREVLAA
jgi:hypothetical protein